MDAISPQGRRASGALDSVPFGPERHMQVLYVEDSPLDAALLLESLHESGADTHLDIYHVDTLGKACAAVVEGHYDCVLLDLGLPDGQGVENVRRILKSNPDVTIVVMTGEQSAEIGVKAIHNGAQEYLIKGQIEFAALTRILRHAVERNELLCELKALREREYFMATHDVLTRLPNRQLFEDRAQQILVRAERNQERLAICYLDLDGFKPVNDSFGHATGDALLQAIATQLRDVVRDSDTVARVGGDEFVLLLYPLEDRQQAQRISARIIERIGSITQANSHPVDVSTSIGISLYPEHGRNLQDLRHHADIAMYKSKNRMRGGFEFFDTAMLGETRDRRLLIGEIDEALQQSRFRADYQPWIDLTGGRVQGFEAMLRWHAKSGDVHHPHYFLDAAQESGQVLKIARSVYQEAIGTWVQWRNSRLMTGRLAINISLRELGDSHYLRELMQLFDDAEISRDLVQMHLDAGKLLQAGTQALRTKIAYLQGLGVPLVLDRVDDLDAAEQILDGLQFEGLRININGLLTPAGTITDAGMMLASGFATLAMERDLQLVAVGVENRAQMQQLQDTGYLQMQGFLFAPPVAAAQVPGVLSRLSEQGPP